VVVVGLGLADVVAALLVVGAVLVVTALGAVAAALAGPVAATDAGAEADGAVLEG
jgi:hypothetical protein